VTGYLAAEGYLDPLLEELGEVRAVLGRLALADGPPRPAYWAQNVWLDPVEIPIASIADAATRLRAIQRNWALYSWRHHRRAALIEAKLPKVSAKPLRFGDPAPEAALGSWTLLDERTVLAAARQTSPFPNGEVRFVEDREGPPSRAYLKLWEALTMIGRKPRPGDLCLDLGAAPGGWSWALQRMGARVIAVDKAPLEPRIAALPGVRTLAVSAFSLAPEEVGPIDWLVSDLACYPRRLIALVERWLASRLCRNFVCTVKFQGRTDHESARRLAAVPGSRLVHLAHNKHELTWILVEPGV
jgi:23S rRNA (cytidine2498-2'-O)-methyltransferase